MVEDRQESTRFLSPDETISRLQAALEEEEQDGKRLARLVRTVLEDRQWSRFQSVATGVTREHDSFQSFVTKERYAGLGTTLDGLVHMVEPTDAELADDVKRAWQEEIAPVAKHGGDRRSPKAKDNQDHDMNLIHPESNDGILARLKRDDPDLAAQVVNGELSANQAALSKGWRKPRIVLTSPESIARKLHEHLSPDDVAALKELL